MQRAEREHLNAVYVPLMAFACRTRMAPIAGANPALADCAISQAGWSGRAGWYVLACNAGREFVVGDRLKLLGLHVFVPVERVVVSRGRGERKRKLTVDRGYFPGYLFVQCGMDVAMWRRLRSVDGVREIVASEPGAIPRPVADGLVEALLAEQMAGKFNPPVPVPYKAGQAIRVVDGPFSGLIGECQRLDSKNRVSVLLRIMGSVIPVRFEMAGVESAVEGKPPAF